MNKLLLILLFLPIIGFGQLVINEFCSKGSVEDFDGENNDWLELINTSSSPINLSNYFLSDNINNISKWNFPSVELDSMQKILILCSGKDRKERVIHWESIVNENTFFKYFLGTQEPDSNWISDINDSTWLIGLNGIGFGDNDDSTIIANTSSLYLRHSFHIINKEDIVKLLLHADYDDSFVAYLNGIEIARSENIYGNPITYQTLATSPHEASVNTGEEFDRFLISKLQLDTLLNIGINQLAIQVHDFDSIPDDMSARFFLHTGMHSDTIYFNSPINWLNEKETYYHTNFKLSQAEDIIISDNNGNILDQKLINYSNTFVSEGRSPDGVGSWCYFSPSTPGFTNDSSNCFNEITPTPTISTNSGWFSSEQYITISPILNTHFFYTTNGDVPDTNDNLYSDTLSFDSTTVLSVRAFSVNNLPSKVVDRTYIINEDNHDLPVFSIITDSLNLWDLDSGIYVVGNNGNPSPPYYGANFRQPWSKWSRLEFFDKDKIKQEESEIDLEIHGGWSRQYPQKSFRLDFKSIYTGDFEVSIFTNKPHLTSFNNINLRNGGNMSRRDKIRDGFFSIVAAKTDIDYLAYEPCILYLNGEYWGIYGIREKADEHYISDNYGFSKDSIDLINGHAISERTYCGSDLDFINSYHQLMNANSSDNNFLDLIKDKFDIENLIDYFIFQTYIGNYDWIPNASNNVKLWKSRYQNGKWRYILYDTDFGFLWSNSRPIDTDYIYRTLNPNYPSKHSDLFNKLIQNDDFKCQFVNRYIDIINTVFNADYFSNKLISVKNEIISAMPEHLERWPSPYYVSINGWENLIDDIANDNPQRATYVLNHLQSNFQLDTAIDIYLDVMPPQSGNISFNNISPDNFPFDFKTFSNLCDSRLIAFPEQGFVFSHWNSTHINSSQIFNDTIDLSLNHDDTITAHYRECSINNLDLIQDTTTNSFAPIFDAEYGPYSFQWLLDNDTIMAAEDSSIYPVITGFYSVSVTDKDGCNTISPSVFFDCNILVESYLNHDLLTNSLHTLCNGGTQPYSYQWFYNNDSLLYSVDTIHYPLESGYYYFTSIDINGCKSISDSLFTEDCGSVIEPILLQDSIDNSLYISCNGGTQPYSYQWFIDSVAIENVDQEYLDIYTSGNYYTIIEDVNGCKSFTNTVVQNELEAAIFPNPTSDLLNIQFIKLGSEKYTISVFDLNMNILHSIEVPVSEYSIMYTHTFYLDIYKTGLYLIRLESSNSQLSKRFIYLK